MVDDATFLFKMDFAFFTKESRNRQEVCSEERNVQDISKSDCTSL